MSVKTEIIKQKLVLSISSNMFKNHISMNCTITMSLNKSNYVCKNIAKKKHENKVTLPVKIKKIVS